MWLSKGKRLSFGKLPLVVSIQIVRPFFLVYLTGKHALHTGRAALAHLRHLLSPCFLVGFI
jgi:hypothetical protein